MTSFFRTLWSDATAETAPRILICAAAVWCVLWLAVPMLFAVLPPSDNIEQMVWAQGWELGYHKHPPLPTWILIGATQLAPLTPELTYALALTGILIGGYFYWRLAEALLGKQGALLAVLSTAVIGFYSYRTHIFNHNTVLAPFVYAAAWYYYRAVRDGRWSDWLVLGVVCAGAILAKYQFLLLPVIFAFIAWRLRLLSRPRFWGGVLLAMGVAIALLLPHLWWLVQTDFLPFQHAGGAVMAQLGPGRRTVVALGFLAQQVRNVLPALALIWFAVLVTRRKPLKADASTNDDGVAADAKLWAWSLGLLPVAMMLALGLVLGTKLENHWGTMGLQFIALPVALWARRRELKIDARAAFSAFLFIQALTVVYYVSGELYHGNAQLEEGRVRAFDPVELGRAVDRDWHRVTQEPLRYVVGTTTLGGFVALYAPDKPQLLLDGRSQHSPWVDMATFEKCGAVYVDSLAPPPGRAVALQGGYTSISYMRKRAGEKQTISWVVVAPEASCSGASKSPVVGEP